MEYCLDTDIIIEFFRGNKQIEKKMKELIDKNMQLSITYITLCELYKGAYLSKNPEKELSNIKRLLESVEILDFSILSCNIFGSIYAELFKEGNIIQDADLLTAAIVKSYNKILVTRNIKHFERIKNLKLESWL